MGAVTVGVDFGKKRDPTAIAVVELEYRPRHGHADEAHHIVRFLERMPLMTGYPQVAERVAAVVRNVEQQLKQEWFEKHWETQQRWPGERPMVYVDAGGVGTAATDILIETGMDADLMPVFFTSGDRRVLHGDQITLGKAFLVSRMQVLMQSGRLHLPRNHPEADAMSRELETYEIKVDENANDTYGAFKTGAHDDLVTAVGLAVQTDGGSVATVLDITPEVAKIFAGGSWRG